MKFPATTPLEPSSTGEDASLLSKALRGLSGAISLKDGQAGHYLAKWALLCPLAQQQFNNAVQRVNTVTPAQTMVEACKAAVKAYTATLLPPPPFASQCSTYAHPSLRGGPSRSSIGCAS